ncbi:ERF family protein [Zhengella sp. ZM62]|uniref:ERF family protein n=1 Tax=Zhengella sedimenti TaxID=3390035 RepID=UPI0039761225
MNEVAHIERGTAPAAQTETNAIISVIERAAVNPAVDMDKMERLLEMQERIMQREALAAFNRAFAAAKSELPAISKNQKGHNNRYADFAHVARAVDPVLSRHGLSYRFKTRQDDQIHVTCVLSHIDGHSEENTLSSKPDTAGSKNATQAIGSAQTYLMRYSLLSALGVQPTDDDDGRAANMGDTITKEDVEVLRAMIEEAKADTAQFCEYLQIESIPAMPASMFRRAVASLQAKKRKMAQEGKAND